MHTNSDYIPDTCAVASLKCVVQLPLIMVAVPGKSYTSPCLRITEKGLIKVSHTLNQPETFNAKVVVHPLDKKKSKDHFTDNTVSLGFKHNRLFHVGNNHAKSINMHLLTSSVLATPTLVGVKYALNNPICAQNSGALQNPLIRYLLRNNVNTSSSVKFSIFISMYEYTKPLCCFLQQI